MSRVLFPQLPLPFTPPRRVRHGRQVVSRPERTEVHDAVIALRRASFAVYRAGADHKVGDRLLSTQQLLRLARAIARRSGQ